MPSKTFFILKEEKKERIEKALIHEFGKGSFEQASITNIVKDANIPRGSFYQYFEDKKDAVSYLIEKFILLDYEQMKQSLIETKGNLFETALKIYDYRTNETVLNFDLGLAKNILEELRRNNINVFENKEILKNKDSLVNFIDRKNLNISTDKDLNYCIAIITAITRAITLDVFSENISKEEGREKLKKELEIIRIGMGK